MARCEAASGPLAPASTAEPFGLGEILAMLEDLSGLEASVYPADPRGMSPAVEVLPVRYRRHMSAFCRAVKNSRDGQGCRGHDSRDTCRRAGREGRPFVQRCRAGVAEVIVPVMHGPDHLATVCLGQAVTETVAEAGFAGIRERLRDAGVDARALRRGYEALPRMPENRLLQIGRLLDAAIRGLAERLSASAFAREVRLQHAPAVRRALDLLSTEKDYAVTAAEMAERVHLSVSHFSRLFHRVMEVTFRDYLIALRIRQAQTLLHHTDTPIGDIAMRCGFSRQSYFARRFKRITGMTPSRYRDQRDAAGG